MKNTTSPILKTVAASAAAMSLATAAFAGETVHVSKNPAPPAPESFYNAHEIELGVSALLAARTGSLGPRSNFQNSTRWGADVELAYFITRNFGVSLEQQWIDVGNPLWNSTANLILRAPLNEGSRWAPYLFTGAGALYARSQGRFEYHVGAGLEYRFTPKIGTFIDGRHEWVNGKNDVLPQFGAFRAGLKFVF